MAWGVDFELYLLERENENSVSFDGKNLPAIGVKGENWTVEEVHVFIQDMKTFLNKVEDQVKKHPGKFVIRSNM